MILRNKNNDSSQKNLNVIQSWNSTFTIIGEYSNLTIVSTISKSTILFWLLFYNQATRKHHLEVNMICKISNTQI